jgi:hypothetical protein
MRLRKEQVVARRDGAIQSWAEALSPPTAEGHINPAFVYSSDDES